MKRRPASVRAVRDVADYISSLREDEYLRQIVGKALDVLRENMFAGEKIEKSKFPKYYVLKYGINNLYKYNLNGGYRLIYTLVADESGVALVVLDVLSHKQYERRFRYD